MILISSVDMREYLLVEYRISELEAFENIKAFNRRRKNLKKEEYIDYVLRKINKNSDDIEKEIKTKFENYNEFRK